MRCCGEWIVEICSGQWMSLVKLFEFVPIYVVPSISFQTFLYRHLKLS